MDTRIKFIPKEFSKISKSVEYIKKHPTLPLVAGSFTVGTANLATNVSRHNRDREYQDKQLKAMNNLTKSLTKLDNSVQKQTEQPQKKPTFITFRRLTK